MIGQTNVEKVVRDGVELEKGVTLTSDFLDNNAELFQNYLNYWILYPDLFLDSIQTTSDKYFHLLPYQRIALRASMRYRYHSWTATRATSKSFTAYLAGCVRCVLLPGTKLMLSSEVKGTVIKTAKQKFDEIWQHWPLLRNELKTISDDGIKGEKKSNDYYELNFKNGSTFTVVAKDTSRGMRANAGILEESATIDKISYTEVLLPQLNVARREVDGYLNPEEPLSPQTFITTASDKNCFMYQKLIEMVIMQVLRPEEYFIWGLSYVTPVFYKLITKQQLEDQRDSSTMSEDSFARESLSIWTGNSNDSWFDDKVLNSRRTLLKCERKESLKNSEPGSFYVIGCDIGRFRANTAIVVVKVIPKQEKFLKRTVYLEVINGESFITHQAPRIKELIELYHPREVVIDSNGLGAGLMDAMVLETIHPETGKVYPPYYAFNNEQHLPPTKKNISDEPIPRDNAILYSLKANAQNDNIIHSNIYAQVSNGSLSLLANERIVKDKLMATKKGQRMDAFDRRAYLLPYEMTSRLIDEMNNLRLKPTGIQNQIKIEQISRSTNKDRFSALEYALYRVKYYEDRDLRKGKQKGGKYAYFSPSTTKKSEYRNRRG